MTTFRGYTNRQTFIISHYFTEEIESLNTLVFDFDSYKENYFIDFNELPTEEQYIKYLSHETHLLAEQIKELVQNTYYEYQLTNPMPDWIDDLIDLTEIDWHDIAQTYLEY